MSGPQRVYDTVGPDGAPDLTPQISDFVNCYDMDGINPKTIAWPTNANYCNIAGTANYWVAAAGQTAAVPATADNTSGTGSALNPAQRKRYHSETTFSIISSTAQFITVEFWN